MKKSLLCMCALALLSAAALIGAHNVTQSTAETVELIETGYIGDPAQAQDLELGISCSDREQLFWDTTLIPGQMPKTEFRFLPQRYYAEETISDFTSSHIRFGGKTNSGITAASGMDSFEGGGYAILAPIYQKAAERTQPGTTHTEVFSLADCLDTYPLEIDCDIPQLSLNSGLVQNLSPQRAVDEFPEQTAFMNRLYQAFRFPIPDDVFVTVQISKGMDGLIYRADCAEGAAAPRADQPFDPMSEEFEAVGASEDVTNVLANSWHTATADAIYFVPELRQKNGQLLDYSLTPGGYGLYRLSFPDKTLSGAQLEFVLPLQPEQNMERLAIDDSGHQLMLSTSTDHQETLYLLDADSGELRQTIPAGISDLDHDDWVTYHSDGGILLIQQSNRSFRLLIQQQNGDYQEQFTCSLADLVDLPVHWSYDFAFAFDGQRLAILADSMRQYDKPECGLSLMIWDKNGLLYAGNYVHSLDRSPEKADYYAITPLRNKPLSLRFL